MNADIQAVFPGLTDDVLDNMHPQNVASKYQQAHRIERRRMKQAAYGVMLGNAPKGLDHIEDY